MLGEMTGVWMGWDEAWVDDGYMEVIIPLGLLLCSLTFTITRNVFFKKANSVLIFMMKLMNLNCKIC